MIGDVSNFSCTKHRLPKVRVQLPGLLEAAYAAGSTVPATNKIAEDKQATFRNVCRPQVTC